MGGCNGEGTRDQRVSRMKTPQYTALRRYAHSTPPILPAPTLLRDKLIVPDAAHRFVIQHNVYRITHCFVLSKHGLRNVGLRRGRGRKRCVCTVHH